MTAFTSGQYAARPLQKIAALIVPCLASLSIFAMPFIFSAMIEAHALDLRRATFATSAEISLIALGSIAVSFALKILSPNKTCIISVLMICLGQLGTIYLSNYSELLFSRAIVGLGEGLCMGVGFSCLAQMNGGAKLLSWCTGIVAALSLVSFILIPEFQPYLGAASVFWVMLAFAVVCLPLAPFIPEFKVSESLAKLDAVAFLNVRSISLFLVGVLASCGSNTLWLYFEQIGTSSGMSVTEVGRLGSFSSIPTLIVPLVANFVYSKSKTIVPVITACMISAFASYYYANPSSAWMFSAIVVLMTFVYIFILAFVRMYSAHIDSSGRTTAAVGGADSVGMVVGPLLAAFILNLDSGFQPLGMFGLIMQLLCLVPCLAILVAKFARPKGSIAVR
ncbi:MFS transporter [Pseudomonas sp. PB3P13]